MKNGFLFLILTSLAAHLSAQNGLVKMKLTNADTKSGVMARYQTEHIGYISSKVVLYKNKTFRYETWQDFTGTQFSERKWFRKGGNIILNSSLDSENLPITVKYINDSVNKRGVKFMTVKSLIDSNLLFSYIHINTKKTTYLPYRDTCIGPSFYKMDSIKVELSTEGRELSSKWIKVPDAFFNKIQITVDIDFDPSDYLPIYNMVFETKDRYLQYVK